VHAHPPYALVTPAFHFRALAALAGRATLGGARELLVGALLMARLADACTGPHPLTTPQRRARANAARAWLASLTLPAIVRAVFSRVMEATATDDRRALAEAWDGLVSLVTPSLDMSSRAELRRLALALTGPQ
jgi:hypothetical protein